MSAGSWCLTQVVFSAGILQQDVVFGASQWGGTWCLCPIAGVNFDHWVEVASARFLHCEVVVFLSVTKKGPAGRV